MILCHSSQYKDRVLEKLIQDFLWWRISQRHSLINTKQPFKPAFPGYAGGPPFSSWFGGSWHIPFSSYIHLLCEQCPLCARNARNSKGSKTPNELTTCLMIMHIQKQEKEKTRQYVIKMRKRKTKGNCG